MLACICLEVKYNCTFPAIYSTRFRIGPVTGEVIYISQRPPKGFRLGKATGPMPAALTLGRRRHQANTADLGPVLWPIRNHLINNLIVFGPQAFKFLIYKEFENMRSVIRQKYESNTWGDFQRRCSRLKEQQ